MIKEHKSIFRKIEMGADFGLLFVGSYITNICFIIVYGVSDISLYSIVPDIRYESFYYLSIFVFASLFVLFGYFSNVYFTQRYLALDVLLKRMAINFFQSAAIVAVLLFLINSPEFPLVYFLVYSLLSFVIVAIYKVLHYSLIRLAHERGYNLKHVLILGKNRDISFFKKSLKWKYRDWGLRVVRTVFVDRVDAVEKFENTLKSKTIDVIFVISGSDEISIDKNFKTFLEIAEQFGKAIRIFLNPNAFLSFYQVKVSFLENLPTLHFTTSHKLENMGIVKSIIDVMGGIVGSLITLMMLPFIASLIKLTSTGPVFFLQKRIGSNHRPFYIYKFRTMVVNAEELKNALKKHNQVSGAMFKMDNDPRITSVGKFLRKFSIDEFPQFFNVLKGDMSLVGTRPPTPDEVKAYENWHHKRIAIKPGITGLWQVSGRNRIKNFDDIVKLDIEYIEKWDIWLDIKIIIKTFTAIFHGR